MLRPLKGIAPGLLAFSLPIALAVFAHSDKTSAELEGRAEYNYILTMEKANKLSDILGAVGDWLEENERPSKALEEDRAFLNGTLAERSRILDMKYPELVSIIRSNGMSTQEYLLGNQVEVHALLLLDAKEQGKTKNFAKNVNPVNLIFVEQHANEVFKNVRFRM